MKRLLHSTLVVVTVAIVMTACKSTPGSTQQSPAFDTTGLAAFQQMKALEAEAAKQKQVVYITQKKSAPEKTYTMNSESTHEGKVAEKKKGWSKSAKYAVIGATGGGLLGAVINKKDPVKGAIVGAVVLGGGGYILGRSQDKKDGRL